MTPGVSMATIMSQCLALAVLLSSLITTGSAMSCYICNSTLDHNCQERFDHSLSVTKQKMQECDMWNAKFCIKATGVWGGVVGTHRFCSSRDMGYQCQDIWYPDHDRMYRACIYSCTTDNCNAAGQRTPAAILVGMGVGMVYLLQRMVFHR